MARVALTSLKAAVKNILDTANTTTGSPIDLSDSMAHRVQKVLQVNVEKIPIQPSFFPCITMFYDNKQVELKDIAANLLTGRRMTEIDLKIVGIIWNDNMNTSGFELTDLADNECEQLMENIEQVLRSDPTLAGLALSSKTIEVSYHTYQVSEDTHMRAGIMNHRIRVLY